MKTKKWQWRTVVRTAAMTALLAAPPMASAANGGVIRFVGAIVAPPLQISTAAAPVAIGVASVTGQSFARTVTFSAPSGTVSGANVALEVNGSTQSRDLVATRFVDRGGRVSTARDGRYTVGHDGGVLSLDAKRTDVNTRVTVVVSYD
ncbi:hypothetical protein [Paraburkholderia antibiotica]|uniref:DUF4402 domain-containing protein n=1 Tax=Paraburkholderia antibiotica TaxID=2728839 RepID=A0A7X9X1M2_9BURK|nr:hypothetical protein [Paraburkholderia antibiotica]NML29747.1 hypothetical protein [Paraburkholderia antibiotica]